MVIRTRGNVPSAAARFAGFATFALLLPLALALALGFLVLFPFPLCVVPASPSATTSAGPPAVVTGIGGVGEEVGDCVACARGVIGCLPLLRFPHAAGLPTGV